MPAPILHLGDKNYSSWSLRPWLALTWGAIAFEERVARLGAVRYGKSINPEILAASPSGRVPVLRAGDLVVHDSLAICEWAAELAPALLPQEPTARALARSISAEMHAGFSALRAELPMNIRRRLERMPEISADARGDIARIEELWTDARARFGQGGPFLFGARTIADAMYAPVATRFRTYAISLSAPAQDYCEAIFSDGAFKAWERAAHAETTAVDSTDKVYT